ncbi:peptide/nickel transport system ATP-binding protein [Williamsia sterculiae]|uniref:Peptide/nickel transport system ATP-binding protein n=2 Tax=Williamsia sterculiae TaxID=1344003 RepID=A0A1N7D099_9NOCA|nr:peptide/nickel transport system ATP-binding protein [Williamsia sterculiae]
MGELLTVRGLGVDFRLPGVRVHAVRDLDLDIGRGEVVALVGESGSGKSATASAIAGLLPHNAEVTGGSVRLGGTELIGLSQRQLNAHRGPGMGMIFQNPVTSLDPSFTVGEQLGDVAHLHQGANRRDSHDLAADWLQRAGITDTRRVLRSFPHELSGGMRQRVMIALAGIAHPALLIADEPTTALDATVQKRILDLLLRLSDETSTAILLITHDFGVVSYASARVAVMNQGRVVEVGSTADVLADPQHEYTRNLIASVPSVGLRHRSEPGSPRRLLTGSEEPRSVAAQSGADDRVSDEPTALLELRGVTKQFVVGGVGTGRKSSTVPAVGDVTLDVRRGEVLGLIGESGSGKSTLARVAGGLIPRDGGTVLFDGADVEARESRRQLRRRFQYVFQDATTALNPRITVGDQIARPLLRLGRAGNRRAAAALAGEALEQVGLNIDLAQRYPRELSGGQRQRVGIARAIGLRPDLLILDEPTSALDATTQASILNLLLDLRDQLGLTYVFIGHNLAVVEFVCDRIGVMQDGELLETFAADDLFADDRHPATRALLDSVLPIGGHATSSTPALASALTR